MDNIQNSYIFRWRNVGPVLFSTECLLSAVTRSADKSREELLTAFHLEEGDDVLADIGKSIKSIFEQDVKKTMVQANGAFIDGRLDVLGEYKAALMTHFDSDIQEVSISLTY